MVQLYTANHPITTGISDLLKVIVLAGKSHNLDIEISNSLTSKVILFIDEFSSGSELKRLLSIKNKKNIHYVLVSTEFETNSSSGPSFNEFSTQNRFVSWIISWTSLLLYWTPKWARNHMIIGKLTAFLALLIMFPMLLTCKMYRWASIVDNIRFLKRSIYMKARRRGYDEFRASADLVIKIHQRLNDASDEDVLYPVLPKAPQLSNEIVRVSGTQTAYRLKMCDNFLGCLEGKDGGFVFDYAGSIDFDTSSEKRVYGFAYQPAQSGAWNKSNPIKIWRDCFFHDALPIVDKKFNDHPLEVMAITTDQFFAKEFDRTSIQENFSKYDKLVNANNEKIFHAISMLVGDD
jgi:hypothetical protein